MKEILNVPEHQAFSKVILAIPSGEIGIQWLSVLTPGHMQHKSRKVIKESYRPALNRVMRLLSWIWCSV
jgi:hypothetical protein